MEVPFLRCTLLRGAGGDLQRFGERLVDRGEVGFDDGVELRLLRGELVAQFLEDGVGAGDGFAVAGLDDALQGGEFVVELNGEVQRVLAAAVLYLVDLFLDGAQLLHEGIEFQGPIGDLLFEVTDGDHDLVGFAGAIADLHGELELLGEVGDGDGVDARVLLDVHALGESLAVDGEAHGVGAGNSHRTAASAAPEDHALEALRSWVAEIPGVVVDACFAWHGRRRTASAEAAFFVAGVIGGAASAAPTASAAIVVGGAAGIGSDHLAFGVEDVDLQFVGGLLEEIRDAALADVALGDAGLEEVLVGTDDRGRELAQRRDVVKDVEGAAVGGDHEVAAFDDEIGDLRIGQVQREGLPLRAVVEGNVDSVFRAGEEQTAAAGIFTDGVNEIVVGDAVDDLAPCFAVVVGLEDVGVAIVVL